MATICYRFLLSALCLLGISRAPMCRAAVDEKELHTLAGHQGTVLSVAFSPDGNLLATADAKGVIKFWDPTTGKEEERSVDFGGVRPTQITRLAFSPDGTRLAAIAREYGESGVLHWDMETKKVAPFFAERIHRRLADIAYSSDGKFFAVAGEKTVSVWDAKTGKKRFEWNEGIQVTRLVFAPDCKSLVFGTSSYDLKNAKNQFILVNAMDLETGNVQSLHKEKASWPVEALAFVPKKKSLAYVHGGGLFFLDLEKKESKFVTRFIYPRLAFHPDGASYAIGENKVHSIRIFSVADKKEILALKGHTGSVTALAFSPDGKMLASGSADHSVKLWSMGQKAKQ